MRSWSAHRPSPYSDGAFFTKDIPNFRWPSSFGPGYRGRGCNECGGKDVFVHISAVERAGLSSLNEGTKVSYEEKEDRGKTSAENLRVG